MIKQHESIKIGLKTAKMLLKPVMFTFFQKSIKSSMLYTLQSQNLKLHKKSITASQ